MKCKQYPIQAWFLDNDLQMSAQMHSDKLLSKSINGCYNALFLARLYYIGIRSRKFYNYFLGRERKKQTMEKFFPLWPLKSTPSFAWNSSRLSKWTRLCKEHYDYILQYFEVLLNEYEFRKGKQHVLCKVLDWFINDAPELKIPIGNLKKIEVPWKVLDPKYRRKDIIEGYRLKCKAYLGNYGIKLDDFSNRDIPEFLMEKSSKWTE